MLFLPEHPPMQVLWSLYYVALIDFCFSKLLRKVQLLSQPPFQSPGMLFWLSGLSISSSELPHTWTIWVLTNGTFFPFLFSISLLLTNAKVYSLFGLLPFAQELIKLSLNLFSSLRTKRGNPYFLLAYGDKHRATKIDGNITVEESRKAQPAVLTSNA